MNNQSFISIEQDHDILIKRYHGFVFDFDLTDKQFIEYFISRTSICIDQTEDFKALEYLLFNSVKNEQLHLEFLRYRLQDCWELYQFEFI